DLASRPIFQVREPHLDWLRALAEAAPDEAGMRGEIRAACRETHPGKRRAALEKLAAEADVSAVPPRVLVHLARLQDARSSSSAVQLLRRGRRQHPADFWLNHELGWLLTRTEPLRWEEAARCLSVAVALRPNSPGVRLNLGTALANGGQVDEAID